MRLGEATQGPTGETLLSGEPGSDPERCVSWPLSQCWARGLGAGSVPAVPSAHRCFVGNLLPRILPHVGRESRCLNTFYLRAQVQCQHQAATWEMPPESTVE